MNITEKVSYIKGLAEGLKLEESTKEGKILLEILDLLKDMAYQIEDIDSDLSEMADVVGDLDETVMDIQDELYGDDDDEDCCCHGHDHDDDDDDALYEITCPNCNNSITVDFDVIAAGGILCPNCGEPLEFDLSGLEEETDE